MGMGMLRFAAVVGAAVVLTGCGDDYDGIYAGGTGFMSVAVMTLDGDTAKVETVNTAMRRVVATTVFDAEVRSGKLRLTSGSGSVFVYGLAEDDESLECVSDSCKGFGGLGGGGLPRVWNPHKDDQ
ncbi:MAG: hypothetical protein E6R09_00940 [Rhodocyclaceae bacterium]|nr:MAG: hypothetical protein E6R09_00940 [Rhodocyclaceae bacterium]